MREREYAIGGTYPWNSIDAMIAIQSLPPVDKTDEINKCLRCRKKKCNNCLCNDRTSKMVDKCEELLLRHKTRQEICAILHISTPTFYTYKRSCMAV